MIMKKIFVSTVAALMLMSFSVSTTAADARGLLCPECSGTMSKLRDVLFYASESPCGHTWFTEYHRCNSCGYESQWGQQVFIPCGCVGSEN